MGGRRERRREWIETGLVQGGVGGDGRRGPGGRGRATAPRTRTSGGVGSGGGSTGAGAEQHGGEIGPTPGGRGDVVAGSIVE